MDIRDLSGRQDLIAVVGERIWTAWWQDSGVSPEALAARLSDVVEGAESFALVAVAQDGGYPGSVLLIDSDMESRPELSPWLAALWVEPEARRQGVGQALIAAFCDKARGLDLPVAYLACDAELVARYGRSGATPFSKEGDLKILRFGLS